MITVDEAMEQIQRLYQMRGYPKGDEGRPARMDLVEEIQKARTIAEAKEIIGDFLEMADAETSCPMKSQIRKAVVSRLEEFRYDPDCAKCGGIGSYEVFRAGVATGEWTGCKCLARRPAPVYRRQPAVAADLAGQVSAIAARKRGGEE